MYCSGLFAHGRWFSPGTPASSITKTGRHDIAESGIKHNKSINQSVVKTFMALMSLHNMIERQMCSFLPSYLEGSVESWYHSVSETVQSSLQLIKEALFKRFRPSQLSVELRH
jgi:hypothetical protein